jgi:hypothetical protein
MPSLRSIYSRFTIAGILDRFPEIIRIAGKGRLAFGALVVLFIGIALWQASDSFWTVIYAIAVLAIFGAYVIWIDYNVQIGRSDPPSAPPNSARRSRPRRRSNVRKGSVSAT